MSRILIFAQRFPPSIGGTPTVMRNLCAALPADRIAVLSMDDLSGEGKTAMPFPQARMGRPNKVIRKFDPTFYTQIPKVMRAAAKLSPREETEAIVGVFQNVCFLLAAWRLAKKWKKPFFPYYMDTWGETRSRRLDRKIASFCEPRIFRDAKKILMLSDPLMGYYQGKYPDVAEKMVCIPHCLPPDWEEIRNRPIQKQWKKADELLIVYTGQVYGPTADPIANLVQALPLIEDLNPRVIISSPDSVEQLTRFGIPKSDRVELIHLDSQDEVYDLQKQADILFNPVSFKNRDHVQVQTLFPTKTIEYLVTGKPMLVHGPAETAFVNQATAYPLCTVEQSESSTDLAKQIASMTGSYAVNKGPKKQPPVEHSFSQIREKLLTLLTCEDIELYGDKK